MTKHRLQGLLAGLLIGVILTGGLVFAKQGTEMLEAMYNDIKIFIDGAQLTPEDANGNAAEPFTVNGTTYLPVRAVANAFGKDVAWDGETNSVLIGTVPAERTKLSELKPLQGETVTWNVDNTDNFGNKYTHGVRYIGIRVPANTYDVEKYSKLSAKIAVASNSMKEGDGYKFVFYSVAEGDTKIIAESNELSSLTRPYDITVDLTRVDTLRIDYVCTVNYGKGSGLDHFDVALADAYLE